MNARTPPNPNAYQSSADWIAAFYDYLTSENAISQAVEPQAVLLAHQTTSQPISAAVDGILMYDPAAGEPVVSISGMWESLGGSAIDGVDGEGVPVGGTENQVLAKIDAADYNTEWVTLAQQVPVGTVTWRAVPVAPIGWLYCDGSAVTVSNAALRTLLLDNGSPYGVSGSDPLLPDSRAYTIRGHDDGRGVDSGRVFGTEQLDQMQRITGQFRIHGDGGTPVTGAFSSITRNINNDTWGSGGGDTDRINFDSGNSSGARVGDETRMHNIAMFGMIKT